MQRSTRLVLCLLAGSVGLAGCGDQIVGPQVTVDTRTAASQCGEEQPILYSWAQFYCGEEPVDPGNPGDPGDPLDPGSGGGGTGGGTTPDPFAPPPRPLLFAPDLAIVPGGAGYGLYSCGQITHPVWGLYSGWSQDITRGTTIYFSGVVVPYSRVNWGIYDQYGNQVKTHLTQPSRENCVVHHEPEGVSTWDLAPGYYYLYASYTGLQYYYGVESATGYPVGIQGKFVQALRIR
jgi:hypothetical protein